MATDVDKLAHNLEKQVRAFEAKNGNLVDFSIKHFFFGQHSMILEDTAFFNPDLLGLEKYENWLNE